MSNPEVELHCECARCGKSAYHTVRWLRDNASVACAGCANVVPSIEILKDNTNAVRDFDDAARRDAKAGGA